MQINDLIARANVIDVTKVENDGKVIFGSTVSVKDLENNKKISFKIVGRDEADVKKNLVYFYRILQLSTFVSSLILFLVHHILSFFFS